MNTDDNDDDENENYDDKQSLINTPPASHSESVSCFSFIMFFLFIYIMILYEKLKSYKTIVMKFINNINLIIVKNNVMVTKTLYKNIYKIYAN